MGSNRAGLPRADVEAHLDGRFGELLGPTYGPRVSTLVDLIGERGVINLGSALETLFPGVPKQRSLASLRDLRRVVKEAAARAGVELTFEADSKTRTPPSQRTCWFAGASLSERRAEERSAREVAGTFRQPQHAARRVKRVDGKLPVKMFVSYAHKDKRWAKDLLERLQTKLKVAKNYQVKAWGDWNILPGERWAQEIRTAVAECHVGLLLVSHAFLGSRFITREELPKFVVHPGGGPLPGRRAVPVALEEIRLDGTVDLKGLEDVQIFRDRRRRGFRQLRTDQDKEAFVNELFHQILQLLEKYFPGDAPDDRPGPSVDLDVAGEPNGCLPRAASLLKKRFEGAHLVPDLPVKHEMKIPAQRGRMPGRQLKGTPGAAAKEQREALDFLDEWLARGPGVPYCLLLGEVGMGKTTTARAWTRILLDRRATDPTVPLPIYLDLRDLAEDARKGGDMPSILEDILKKTWKGPTEMTAEELIRLVAQGALVILDGLDEVLVYLSDTKALDFVRQTLRLVPPPPRGAKRGDSAPAPSAGRLLMTCRDNYFRTLQEAGDLMRAEGREGLVADHYEVLELLPLRPQQIRAFLAHCLGDAEVEKAMEAITTVHNLQELAERPFTLNLITDVYEQLRARIDAGERITGVTLYGLMVEEWLGRDNAKHTLTRDHKQLLMENLAARLWREGRRSWSVQDLEQWLIDFFEDRPRLKAHYTDAQREHWKADLRTATFVARTGEDQFRFAHSSLHEYFLARHLLRCLLDGDLDGWAMQVPSPETLGFLGQMIEADAAALQGATRAWRDLKSAYRPLASELLLSYAILAAGRGLPVPNLAGADLRGARLRRAELVVPAGVSFSLRLARLDGADLRDARIRGLTLDEAHFTNGQLDRAMVVRASARGARFGGASLVGTTFLSADLRRADLEGAACHGTRLLRCRVANAGGLEPDGVKLLAARCSPDLPNAKLDGQPGRFMLATHRGELNGCAWSPDGTRLATARSDGSARVWDAQSGDELVALRGHTGPVWGVAWSPDGTRVATAGSDGSARVWDAQSGDELVALRGHTDWVSGVAWSPDGARLVTAGDDGSARAWDAATGDELVALRGHTGQVQGVAWSPDGTRIATASHDGSARVWDAQSGDELVTLRGHTDWVLGVAWSPDGTRLATASSDGSARVWDAATGDELVTLRGHTLWVPGVAWSPDGTRLATASSDGSARVWDAATGDELVTLRGHTDWVQGVAWSPDGTRLATASDESARVWDADTGDELLALRGHTDLVLGVAWSPDGTRIATAGHDGSARVWDAQSGDELLLVQWIVGETCVVDGTTGRPRSITEDALPFAGWRVQLADGRWTKLPAEAFGPLPPPKRAERVEVEMTKADGPAAARAKIEGRPA